jgi:hypothetical protein
MFTALIIRVLTPVILEVIREMLQQLASGQSVSLTEETVHQAMMLRETKISASVNKQWFNKGN